MRQLAKVSKDNPQTASWLKKIFQALIKRFNSMGLARKFYLLYVLLLVVPVVTSAVIIANNFSEAAKSKATEQGMAEIQAAKATVEKNILTCWHAVQLVKSNKEFIEVLSTRRKYSTLDLVEFQREVLTNVDAIKSINTDLYKFSIYINNYDLYEFYPTIHFEDSVKDKAWYNNLSKQMSGWSYNLGPSDDTDSTNVFWLYSELTSSSSQHLGIIVVQMLSNVFFGPLYASTDNKDQFMFILGSNGTIHFIDNNSLASKYLSADKNAGANLLAKIDTVKQSFVTSLGSYEVVVNYEYIPELDVNLLNVTSMEPVNREIRSMVLTVMAGCLLVLGFLSLATYSIVSVLLRKLRTVISLMRHVEHGDLVVEIPELGNDEAGELNRHFRDMLGKINELIYTVYKKQIAAREAEIKSLYSQLNAHFIYNVLESIKMMAVLKFEYKIADSITSLGRIMRYSMNWRKQYVLLREETGNLASYIRLMNLQREIPVELVFDIPDAMYDYEVLKMSLQPLAENAMVHGLKQRKEGGRLEVSAKEDGNSLLISVCDNGCGMPPERLGEINAVLEYDSDDRKIEGAGNGIGLVNINQRIKLFYGPEYGITASSEQGAGACITLRLPAPSCASKAKET